MKNIVLHLQERQVYQAEWAREQRLASAIVTRRVHLFDILDHKRQLLDSHVILGFSRCGQLLLSYRSELDVTATQSTYTLHWWRFLGNCPLQHVTKEPLFRGEPVPADLHLVVCQTPPPMHVVVVGCRSSCAEDFRQPCYVSVLAFSPLPAPSSHHYSLHFKFDLMPPFPSFIPSLSLGVPNCVVLNTGDSVIALHYSSPFAAGASADLLPAPSPTQYSSHLLQWFASGQAPTSSPPGGSPSHLLPVDVYLGDQLMADVSLDSDKVVCLSQLSLDVELWVNEALQAALASRGMAYHSLMDYDLQLAEVCADRSCVVLVLVVLLEASPVSATCLGCYSVEVMASWNICTGTIHGFHLSTLKPTHPPSLTSGARRWNPAAPLAHRYLLHYSVPLLPPATVIAFYNHTVFSGKSLRCLHHTFLPLSLTLSPSPHPSPAL